jgi:hypothetical protein
MTLGAGSSIDTLCCFRAGAANNTAKSNVGFESAIPAGPNNFGFFASGAADSRFDSNNVLICPGHVEKARFDANGYLLLGRGAALPVTAAKLQISGTANLSVVAYNDNTAAIGAGLVPGDIYRKPDGTLMIAY